MLEWNHKTPPTPSWVQTITVLVGNLGFPIAVAAWLLYRIGPLLEQQTRMLEQILKVLERIP